jgi:hypothetical protein
MATGEKNILPNLGLETDPTTGKHFNPFLRAKLAAESDQPTTSIETDNEKVARAKKVAKSELKKKNRKRHKKGITIPYNSALESGTVYTVQNSRSDLDGNWLVVNMTHNFVKGAGAVSTVDLERCITSF